MKKSAFTVIYQDEDIIAVNKSAGLLVAADRWDTEAERLDVLVQHSLRYDETSGKKLYAVHRIDKDTSGGLIWLRSALLLSVMRCMAAASRCSFPRSKNDGAAMSMRNSR